MQERCFGAPYELKINGLGLSNQSRSLSTPRLCLRGPGQEPAAGADLRGAARSTTVPKETLGLDPAWSEVDVVECVCSCGCRCVWLRC